MKVSCIQEFSILPFIRRALIRFLGEHYDSASLEGKRKFLGLIFPEKLVYSNGNYRTKDPNELIALFKGFKPDLKLIKAKRLE